MLSNETAIAKRASILRVYVRCLSHWVKLYGFVCWVQNDPVITLTRYFVFLKGATDAAELMHGSKFWSEILYKSMLLLGCHPARCRSLALVTYHTFVYQYSAQLCTLQRHSIVSRKFCLQCETGWSQEWNNEPLTLRADSDMATGSKTGVVPNNS